MKNKLIIFVFFIVIAAGSVMLMLPADKESIYSENRTPATLMPITAENVKSGKLMTNFEDYLGDNIGLRSELTSASAWMESCKGRKHKLGKIVSANKDIGTASVQKSSLLVADNSVMEIFIRNRQAEEKYIHTINYFANELKDIKVYSMIIPTQLEFKEAVYSNIQDSQKETINYIYSKLDDRITTVDVYGMLKENIDKYIYFRTDHHWTMLGAYYGYCAFLKSAPDSGENVSINDFKHNKIDNFLGSLYKQAQPPELAQNPDTIEWFDTNADENIVLDNSGLFNGERLDYEGILFDEDKENYSLFMSGDQPLSVITNKNKPDGKTILLIKDSYANAFIPWLINNYHRIIAVDPRNCRDSLRDIINDYEPDEFMIMNYIFITTFEDYSDVMIDMMK